MHLQFSEQTPFTYRYLLEWRVEQMETVMLDGYFDLDGLSGQEMKDKNKRLLAVKAALEIAKASVASSDAAAHSRVNDDIQYVADGLEVLVDAIQNVLSK